MPVVTTVFEIFLLLQSGDNVVYRFRTVQSRCFAHSQKRVYPPLCYGVKGSFGSWTDTLCPPGVTLAHAVALVAVLVAVVCCALCMCCCCVVLCCCVYADVCMCLCVCVCFLLFCGYFGNLFGTKDRKVKVYAGHLRCHFLDFFGAYVL